MLFFSFVFLIFEDCFLEIKVASTMVNDYAFGIHETGCGFASVDT